MSAVVIKFRGKVLDEPEMKQSKNGKPMSMVRIVTEQMNMGKEETTWWRVLCWSKSLCELLKNLSVNTWVEVIGQLHVRNFQDDLQRNRYSLDVYAQKVQPIEIEEAFPAEVAEQFSCIV